MIFYNFLPRFFSIIACMTCISTVSFAEQKKEFSPEKVIAKFNGEVITNADILVAESFTPEFDGFTVDQRRAAILSNLIEIRLLAREAEKKGIDKDADFQKKLSFLQQRALYATLIDKEIAGSITDKELRDFYNKEVAAVEPPEEVRARHILVKTKKEAVSIIKSLQTGKKFEDLAKEHSIDSVSAQKGGDLGYFVRGSLVAEFEKTAFELSIGKYTKEPVQTKFGYHIIKVEDKRKKAFLTFEQAKSQILSMMVKQKYLDKMKNLRSAITVDILDEDIKKVVQSSMENGVKGSKTPNNPEAPSKK